MLDCCCRAYAAMLCASWRMRSGRCPLHEEFGEMTTGICLKPASLICSNVDGFCVKSTATYRTPSLAPPLKPSPAGGRWRVAPDEGQHPLALLHPLSQALSGLPALPLGELARERLRGRAPPSGELSPQVTERVRAPNKNSLCTVRCRGSSTLQAVTYSCTYPDSSSGSRRW